MVKKRRSKEAPTAPQPAVSDTAIRSLAHKAGVKRVGKGVCAEFRKMLGG